MEMGGQPKRPGGTVGWGKDVQGIRVCHIIVNEENGLKTLILMDREGHELRQKCQ